MDPQLDQYSAITVIEFHMMDAKKYFAFSTVSSFGIRTVLYPFSLIKTRLQLQRHNSTYNSLFDAFRKIRLMEGTKGLYRGFWVNNLTIVSQIMYIGAYEKARNYLVMYSDVFQDQKLRSLAAGAFASVVGQTTLLPVDIVAQHLQMINLRKLPSETRLLPKVAKTQFGLTTSIIKYLYKQDGVKAFYKGYFASLATYAPSSALWWFFYDIYCSEYLFCCT